MSSAGHEPVAKQYQSAAKVPLIKSPSLWLPKPVEMPTDIHPLPDDITAYFVYPFTLEPHILSMNPQPHHQISQTRTQHAAYLTERKELDARKEKDKLNRMAPGYDPNSFLVPISMQPTSTATPASPKKEENNILDPMDDIMQQLAELENK